MLETKLFGFDHIKELYVDDRDFALVFSLCLNGSHKDFFRHDGYLFKGAFFILASKDANLYLINRS